MTTSETTLWAFPGGEAHSRAQVRAGADAAGLLGVGECPAVDAELVRRSLEPVGAVELGPEPTVSRRRSGG
jgi:hypothetical protein